MECKLEDIFEFIRNGANIKQGHIDGGYPITRIETISNSYIDTSKVGYAGVCELGKFKDYLLKDGDILMSHINSEKHLGKTAIYENINEDIIHGMNLLCFRPNITKVVPKYINYYFNTKYFKIKLPKITKKSVNQASFSVNDLKNLYVYIPSLERQQKVANVLDKAQSLIDKRKVQIEALDELVKSRFIEMFGNPATNSKRWTVEELSKCLINIQNGKSFVCENYSRKDEYPAILKLSAVTYGIYDSSENKALTNEELFIESVEVKKGDLLFTRKNTPELVGMSAYVYETSPNLMMPDLIFRLNTNEKCNKVYLWKLINHDLFREKIKVLSNGSAKSMSNISKQRLMSLNIPIPPIELQNQFADFIKQVDKLKFEMEKSLKELKDNFNSLMQKAFNGELFN
ncbi:restriction endonuclease subunit S [Clostridium botulinum]|uniref:restriction endonuclease subunit S n=1 Tax=Clostridium botulinum TaxID=1491 RepID=UPI001788C638|nr:restriction endonuclease subunit S [Clostridium botulinum]MBE1303373.1 restriction endonuclease subunit S [Clostridium botulinum]